MNLNNFALNTDYDSLKNDANGTFTVTVPASSSIGAGTEKAWTQDIQLGSSASLLNVKVKNNRTGPSDQGAAHANQWYVLTGTNYQRFSGLPGYSLQVTCFHNGGNTIRCRVSVFNAGTSTLTTDNVNDVFTFAIRTYLAPTF